VALAVFFSVIHAGLAGATVIEPDPELHGVLGDMYALATAMRLHHDAGGRRLPGLDELARYLRNPLPDGWPANYRIAEIRGGWWIGRRVSEFSTARRFLRNNAFSLGLYEQEGQNIWLGGPFVWMDASPFGENIMRIKVARGDDNDYIFFNSPETAYYWRGELALTAEAAAGALEKFATDSGGPFIIPPPSASEPLRASPVELPPDFTVGRDEDEMLFLPGSMITLPLPRPNE
jgi:hypothetical protein